MTEYTRPCKLSIVVILSFGAYTEKELTNLMGITSTKLQPHLWVWENEEHIIERHKLSGGSSVFCLTDIGWNYLNKIGKTRPRMCKNSIESSEMPQQATL